MIHQISKDIERLETVIEHQRDVIHLTSKFGEVTLCPPPNLSAHFRAKIHIVRFK